MSELLGVLYLAAEGWPGRLPVIIGTVALVPAMWLAIFGSQRFSNAGKGVLVVSIVLLASALVLGPAVWQSTRGAAPEMNPGLHYIPMVLVLWGTPLLLALSTVGWLTALIGRALSRSDVDRRRICLFVTTALFVPVMSFALWLGVGLGQTG